MKKNRAFLCIFLVLMLFNNSCFTIMFTTGIFNEKTPVKETLIGNPDKVLIKSDIEPSLKLNESKITINLKGKNYYSTKQKKEIYYKKTVPIPVVLAGELIHLAIFIGIPTYMLKVSESKGTIDSDHSYAYLGAGILLTLADVLFKGVLVKEKKLKDTIRKSAEDIDFSNADVNLKLGDLFLQNKSDSSGTVTFNSIPKYDYSSVSEGVLKVTAKDGQVFESKIDKNDLELILKANK